MKILIIQ